MQEKDFHTLEQAVAAYRHERERLRFVAEALGGYAYDWDIETGLVDRAAHFASLLGYNDDEISATETWWTDRIHPEDLAGPIADTRAKFDDPSIIRVTSEYRVRHRNGSWRWMTDHARLIRGANGRVIRMVGFTIDVTEERERQRIDREALQEADAIRRRQQEAQAILAQASALLGESLDIRETAHAIARAALPRFADWAVVDGYDEEGRFTRLALAHNDAQMVAAAEELDRRWPPRFDVDAGIHTVAHSGEPLLISDVGPEHFGALARDPEHLEAWRALGVRSCLAVPLRSAGQTLGVLVLFAAESGRRYTEQDLPLAQELGRRAATALVNARLFELERQAHIEAQSARADAEAANQAKSNFLKAMSHELRTPLNAIAGYTELLELGVHGPVNEAQLKALGRIQQSQRHLLSLINEVLNFARLEAGAVQYDMTTVLVKDALGNAESFIAPLVHSKGLQLTITDSDEDLAVRADEAKLNQVLLNLLSNAVKFTDRGGRITVGCSARGNHIEISVTDTGIGISADHLHRIFEPFVQIGRTLSNPHEGTGLGLAISRDLARGMGGELYADSEPGIGSTFTLSLLRAT